jgi:class 3 adenylate cyclase
MSETRKIAAILVADVVGYSRLAGADEDRTLARLRALRSDLIDPTIAVHHGRIVKLTGDGALVEFRSVVDAVRCAVEVQNGMVEQNAGLLRAKHAAEQASGKSAALALGRRWRGLEQVSEAARAGLKPCLWRASVSHQAYRRGGTRLRPEVFGSWGR